MRPMLATRGSHVPSGDGWTHEVKWDGIRLLADVTDRVRLWARNENDATIAWPELESAAPRRDLLVARIDSSRAAASSDDRAFVSHSSRSANAAGTARA